MDFDERFWSKVEVTGFCWDWKGRPNADGYGVYRVGPRTKKAHRVSYEILVGAIPEGLKIDHVCRNRRCVNPDHLEPVTDEVNVKRGFGPTAMNARAQVCKSGHPFSGENLMSNGARRRCRTCHNARKRAARMKMSADSVEGTGNEA